MGTAPLTELDDEALALLLREAMTTAGTPIREADLWLATVAAERVVDVLRLRGVRVLGRVEDG